MVRCLVQNCIKYKLELNIYEMLFVLFYIHVIIKQWTRTILVIKSIIYELSYKFIQMHAILLLPSPLVPQVEGQHLGNRNKKSISLWDKKVNHGFSLKYSETMNFICILDNHMYVQLPFVSITNSIIFRNMDFLDCCHNIVQIFLWY